MKKILFFSFLAILNFSLFSQPPKPITNAKPATPIKGTTLAKPEIDKLVQKYKDTPTVTLFTSHGDLSGDVEIEYNPDAKPQSIRISGKSENGDAIAEFLSQIISQKKQQGYEPSDGSFGQGEFDASWIKLSLMSRLEGTTYTFKNGKMYFVVKVGMDLSGNNFGKYLFSIETGDNSRKGGKKATKFDF